MILHTYQYNLTDCMKGFLNFYQSGFQMNTLKNHIRSSGALRNVDLRNQWYVTTR